MAVDVILRLSQYVNARGKGEDGQNVSGCSPRTAGAVNVPSVPAIPSSVPAIPCPGYPRPGYPLNLKPQVRAGKPEIFWARLIAAEIYCAAGARTLDRAP